MKKIILNGIRSLGYDLIKKDPKIIDGIPMDMEQDFIKLYNQCRDYTMTSPERMYSVFKSVEYIIKNNIEGDFVECGVWRGGSSMMIALSLLHFKDNTRKIYLYDTFEGMSAPTDKDKTLIGKDAETEMLAADKNVPTSIWCYADLTDVKANLTKTHYPAEQIIYVQGMVENTIPNIIPNKIALLRLDTDWYESTYHELKHLFPNLIKGGILILDDYGHWQGAREAVDQYFKEINFHPFLQRIDYTGRTTVKM